MSKRNTIILGAAGRDFHNFNTFFRQNDNYNVVAFTATQIPDIDGRRYPAGLAGDAYPNGIPIYPEEDLHILIKRFNVQDCIFSYSDVSYNKVMSVASVVQAAGANFILLGPDETMIKSSKPVISVCAVRTGCGKSQTSRKIIELLMKRGKKVIAIRHPMPYGNLLNQSVQRFAEIEDLKKHNCTIEEMEEYEPHIVRGNVIYAGVDYEAILKEAENDRNGCDVIVWDGGNNDLPFYNTDLMITVTDPHRAGHELAYYPGEVNLRTADVVVINKVDSAQQKDIEKLRENITSVNSKAMVIEANSPIHVDHAEIIKNKKVLVVEDGPTLTHGEMKFGAGVVAAKSYGASEIIDPRPYLVGSLIETFEKYPDTGPILPAMGYGKKQLHDLERTIQNTECDGVIIATPIDLSRVLKINKPYTRVYYSLQEAGKPKLEEILDHFLEEH
ncbi:MAG: cyclic 2,3-diphosphoglycerate synthase [Cyclobacteriaceae bacterium]|jgi:predicted GTPase